MRQPESGSFFLAFFPGDGMSHLNKPGALGAVARLRLNEMHAGECRRLARKLSVYLTSNCSKMLGHSKR
jgi:hypothetical protein